MNTKIAASALKVGIVQVLVGLSVIVFLVGLYRCYTYSWQLHNDEPGAASGSMMGDRPATLYDYATRTYATGNYLQTAELLKLALEGIHDANGNIKADRVELAARIKYLSGLNAERLHQTEAAKEYYRETLRLQPGHLYAIWNLERLENPQLAPSGGGGKGEGDGKGDPNAPPQDPKNPNQPQPDPNQPSPPGKLPGPPKRGI